MSTNNNNKSKDPNDPGPEARARIVNELLPKILTPKTLGVKPMGELGELIELRQRKDASCHKVVSFMQPIIQAAIEAPPSSPLHAHSEQGRASLLMTAHKMYCDEIRTWSKDELIFMLAIEYADRTVEHFL